MEFIFYLFIFLFGLVIGSFLNVVIFRLETGEQVVSGRSHCQHCDHTLEWYDLFPVVSFLALGGKCRYCRKRLSVQYPLVELATAILFILIFNFSVLGGSAFGGQFLNQISNSEFFYFLLSTFYFLFIISTLIVIFVYDLRHYIIPDKIVYQAITISLIYTAYPTVASVFSLLLSNNFQFSIFSASWRIQSIFNSQILNLSFFNFLFAAFAAGSFFLAIVVLTKGKGMGGGDVKLAFLMGLILGWPKILAALFLAFTLGAICGIIFVIAKKKALKSAIPFGPFLVLGTFIALFWGEEIVKWYGGFLF